MVRAEETDQLNETLKSLRKLMAIKDSLDPWTVRAYELAITAIESEIETMDRVAKEAVQAAQYFAITEIVRNEGKCDSCADFCPLACFTDWTDEYTLAKANEWLEDHRK